MSSINYSKWDAVELSDDSDIEVHPNVDKASFIRWRQQDIHQRREQRRYKIETLRRTREMHNNLLAQLRELHVAASDSRDGLERVLKHVRGVLDKAKRDGTASTAIPKKPFPEPGEPGEGEAEAEQPTGDTVTLETVLGTLVGQIETARQTQDDEVVRRDLLARLDDQQKRVQERQKEVVKELEKEEKEAKKKITSDNIFKESFDKTMISKSKPTPSPEPTTAAKPADKKSGKKKTEKVVETLNPGAKLKNLPQPPPATANANDDDEDGDDSEDLITTPDAVEFSKLSGFDPSFKFIGTHPHLVSEKVSDQILAEAFSAQLKGEDKRSKNLVFQALQLQYCTGLGKDGINLFYARMNSNDARPRALFQDDVTQTYTRIRDRCVELNAQRAADPSSREVEAIQLQPLGDATTLTVRIPNASDPSAAEALEQFNSFPPALQEALRVGTLDAINKVLAKIEPVEAERIVGVCNEFGFLDVEGEVVEEGSEEQLKLEERAKADAAAATN